MGYYLPQRSYLKPKLKATVSNKALILTISGLATVVVSLVFIFQFGHSSNASANNTEQKITATPGLVEVERNIPIVSNSGNVNFPAMLAFFIVTPNEYSVDIKWATVSEYDNKTFCVEKSVNGSDFKEIGKVDGNGTTKLSNDYEYVDFETPTSVVFYRLKQISNNGSTSFVALEKAEPAGTKTEDELFIENIGPEPFKKTFDINYYSDINGSVSVELVDKAGNRIYKSYTNAIKGYNTCRFINGDKLTDQEYTLRISNSNSVYEKKIRRKI